MDNCIRAVTYLVLKFGELFDLQPETRLFGGEWRRARDDQEGGIVARQGKRETPLIVGIHW